MNSTELTNNTPSPRKREQLVALGERRWLRTDDIRALAARIEQEGEYAPAPHLSGRWRPICWTDLGRWLGSYNFWVRSWNLHETSKDLPLSPDWWDGRVDRKTKPFRLALYPHGGSREIEVRSRGWDQFQDGWSMCRNEVRIADVTWARQRILD